GTVLERRGAAAELARELRDLTAQRDDLRRQVNELSKQVGRRRAGGDVEAAREAMDESRRLGDVEADVGGQADDVEADLRDLLLRIPNIPADDAPDGKSEADNVVLRTEGLAPADYAEHPRAPPWDIGAELGILDTERAAKISGSMFTMLRGLGATLSRALCQLALDRNADAFEEIRPPSLVTTATLTATGQLPKFADDAYAIERD